MARSHKEKQSRGEKKKTSGIKRLSKKHYIKIALILGLLAIPVALNFIKEVSTLEINLKSSHLNLILNYTETEKVLGTEAEILKSGAFDTKYLSIEGFKPFRFLAKDADGSSSEFQITPKVKGKGHIELNAAEFPFSIISIILISREA
jgi:hypothetical protein